MNTDSERSNKPYRRRMPIIIYNLLVIMVICMYMITLICQVCSNNYLVQPYRIHRSKFCSSRCRSIFAGKIGGKAGKGVSRNKGLKRPDLSERNRLYPTKKGRENPLWKETGQTYYALHSQVKRLFGKSNTCELCGTAEKLQLSNKSHTYILNKEDWWTLCAKCHKEYDMNLNGIQLVKEKQCIGCKTIIIRITNKRSQCFSRRKYCSTQCYHTNYSKK